MIIVLPLPFSTALLSLLCEQVFLGPFNKNQVKPHMFSHHFQMIQGLKLLYILHHSGSVAYRKFGREGRNFGFPCIFILRQPCYVAQVCIKFSIPCLSLPNAGIIGLCCHVCDFCHSIKRLCSLPLFLRLLTVVSVHSDEV